MSSGTPFGPGGVRAMLQGLTDRLVRASQIGPRETTEQMMTRLRRLGLSPRQQALNTLWAWYRCANYDARKVDWNGREAVDPIAHEAIATSGTLPAGFVDSGESLPIKFRKPTAPYRLVKVIVDRFTGLLFSERHHPQVHVEGDQDTDEYTAALVEAARLWPQMIQLRGHGGAMGVACVGFQFLDGKPLVEVHDPRWVLPKFSDRSTLKLKSIEKRYMYPEEEYDEVRGVYDQVWYWYRRTIDDQKDVLYQPAPVGDGDEPVWAVDREVTHGLGFCPIVWVQNLPVQDDIDGDPDCAGIYESVEAIDALYAQANKGTVANCDPTVVIQTELEMGEVRKGTDNAIKLDKGGTAAYMEMTGAGVKAAQELAQEFRRNALEVAQCILEPPDMSQRTATEIERDFASMLSKADVLREQYGQRCVVPLVEMMLTAARKLGVGRTNANGEIERQVLQLPPKVIRNPDGSEKTSERKLGKGGAITIKWPRYFDIILSDVELAVRAAGMAKTLGLVDSERAIRFVAEYFRVEDFRDMLERIAKEQKDLRQQAMQGTMDMLRSPPSATPAAALGMGAKARLGGGPGGMPKVQGLGSPAGKPPIKVPGSSVQ